MLKFAEKLKQNLFFVILKFNLKTIFLPIGNAGVNEPEIILRRSRPPNGSQMLAIIELEAKNQEV